jgi:hypothetical protein
MGGEIWSAARGCEGGGTNFTVPKPWALSKDAERLREAVEATDGRRGSVEGVGGE